MSPRRIIVILLLILAFSFTQGQSKVDSLRTLLSTDIPDSIKISSYLALYEELKYDQPDVASTVLTDALSLSRSIDYQQGEFQALLKLGGLLTNRSQYDSGFTIFRQAHILATKLDDRQGMIESLCGQGDALNARQLVSRSDSVISIALELAMRSPLDSSLVALCYNNLGNNAFAQSRFDQALDYYQKTLLYNTTDPRRDAVINMNIALVHLSFQDYDKAVEYLNTALAIARKIGETRVIAQCFDYLAIVSRSQKMLDEARKYNYQAMRHYEMVNDLSSMAHIHSNLSNIHKDLGEIDLAIEEMTKCLNLLQEINFPLGECYTLKNLGELHFSRKDFNRAKDYFILAKERAQEASVLLISTEASKLLSETYAQLGNYEQAYRQHLTYKTLYDSTQRESNKNRLAELEEKYQSEQKQQKIDLLSAENHITALELQKQENLRNYLIIAAILLIVLIAVVYNRYQLKARANAKLRELDQLKTNFFTSISHEFRTPLTLILSPVQKLLKTHSDRETRESLGIIQRNATRLTGMINELLDLSKLEAGKLSLRIASSDPRGFLQVIIASFDSMAESRGIDFKTHLEKLPDEAFFDADKVQKILYNLLSNAFKFTPVGGQVIMKATAKSNKLEIAVTDSGPGIAPEEQPLIFRRFHQSKNNPETTGTGVGLTLSRELALLHKGDISVDSEVNQGSTFTLTFPYQKKDYPGETIAGQPVGQPPIDEFTVKAETPAETDVIQEQIVLIVEDNEDLRAHMTFLLKDQYQVREAANGKIGMEMAREIIPDIIITDLMMPEVDGMALSEFLRADEKTSHIPVILLTAKADRETKLEGLRTGIDDFLTKPFDNEELTVRIENLLKQREVLQQKFTRKILLEPASIDVSSTEEVFINKALEIVDANLSNTAFTVEDFQQEMGMSRMQLHRKLKALTDLSASQFVRDLRLQRAADLISKQKVSVAEAAYSSGFNNLSYFTSCFKEKFGTLPSKYNQKVA